MHYYFRKPKDVLVSNAQLKAEGYRGIDIKSKGGLVIAAGSYDKERKRHYNLYRGRPFAMPVIPSAMCSGIWSREDPLDFGPGFDEETEELAEDEGNREVMRRVFIRYLQNEAPPAIEGENGDETTVRVARTSDIAMGLT